MAATLVNLTGNIADLTGNAFNPRRTRIWANTNIDGDVIIDSDDDEIHLGNATATVDDNGNFTFTDLVATDSATNPTAFQYQVYIEYLKNLPQQTAGGKHSRWSSGWFSLTETADLADVAEESYVPPTWQSTFISSVEDIRDQAEGYADAAAASAALAQDISNIDTPDALVAALIPLGGETTDALTASYARSTSIDVRNFGTFTEASSYTVNTATLQAANDACTSLGIGRIIIPPGVYDIAGYIQDSRVELYGPGATLRHPGGSVTADMIESRLQSTTGTVAEASTSLTVASAAAIERGCLVAIRGAGGLLDAQYTTLTGAIDSSQTTGITLTSSARFPSSGYMLVGDELIEYTGISTATLTGVTRGALGTTAAAHSSGAVIGVGRIHYAEVEDVDGTTITLSDAAPVGVTNATVYAGIVQPRITSIKIDGNRTQGATSPMPIDWRLVRWGAYSDVEVYRGQSAVFLNRGSRDCVIDRLTARDCSAPEISIGASIWLFQSCKRNKFTNITIAEDSYISICWDDRTTGATEWDGPNEDNSLNGFDISVKPHGFAPAIDIAASNRNRILNGSISGAYVGVVIGHGTGQYNVSDSYVPPARDNEVAFVAMDVTIPWTLEAPSNTLHDVTYSANAGSNGSNAGGSLIYATSVTPGGAVQFGRPFPDGNATAAGLAFASEANTGFYRIGAGQWQWVSAGAAIVRLWVNGLLLAAGKSIQWLTDNTGDIGQSTGGRPRTVFVGTSVGFGDAGALPTASATYRGEVRLVRGGTGVADRLVVCRKDAAEAYAWVDLF